MQRGAISAFARVLDALLRCAADPGSIPTLEAVGPGSAVHRKKRCAASGHDPFLNIAPAAFAGFSFAEIGWITGVLTLSQPSAAR